jgi:hypothetical protein
LQSELAIRSLYAGAPNFIGAPSCYAAHGFALSALVPNNEGHFPDLPAIDSIMYRR